VEGERGGGEGGNERRESEEGKRGGREGRESEEGKGEGEGMRREIVKRGGRVRRGREKGRTLLRYVHTKGHCLFLSGRTDKAFSISCT